MKKLQIILIVILLTAFCFTSGFSQDKPLKFGPRLGTALTLTNADISGLTFNCINRLLRTDTYD